MDTRGGGPPGNGITRGRAKLLPNLGRGKLLRHPAKERRGGLGLNLSSGGKALGLGNCFARTSNLKNPGLEELNKVASLDGHSLARGLVLRGWFLGRRVGLGILAKLNQQHAVGLSRALQKSTGSTELALATADHGLKDPLARFELRGKHLVANDLAVPVLLSELNLSCGLLPASHNGPIPILRRRGDGLLGTGRSIARIGALSLSFAFAGTFAWCTSIAFALRDLMGSRRGRGGRSPKSTGHTSVGRSLASLSLEAPARLSTRRLGSRLNLTQGLLHSLLDKGLDGLLDGINEARAQETERTKVKAWGFSVQGQNGKS